MNEEFWANYCDDACEAARAGDLQKAEVHWRLAWAQAQLLPEEDARRLLTLEYLADLLCLRENYRDAEPLLVSLLSGKIKVMGADDINVATTHNALAGLYFALKKFDSAELHCKRALELNEKLLGSESSDVAMISHNLAMVLHAQERFKEAETHYLRALDIANTVYGSEHPESVSIAEHYAGLLDAMGRKKESQSCKKTLMLPILDRLIRTVGEDKTETPVTNKGFSSTLQGIKRDPRRSNQCLYRIKPLPPIDEHKAALGDDRAGS